jgi:hypothetical protein
MEHAHAEQVCFRRIIVGHLEVQTMVCLPEDHLSLNFWEKHLPFPIQKANPLRGGTSFSDPTNYWGGHPVFREFLMPGTSCCGQR